MCFNLGIWTRYDSKCGVSIFVRYKSIDSISGNLFADCINSNSIFVQLLKLNSKKSN